MKTFEPQFNKSKNMWEVWDYAYTENGASKKYDSIEQIKILN